MHQRNKIAKLDRRNLHSTYIHRRRLDKHSDCLKKEYYDVAVENGI